MITTHYVCPTCYEAYGYIADLEIHRKRAHGWQSYDARPTTDSRIAALEEQVRQLILEIRALNTDPERVNLGSFRKDG